RRHDIGGDVGDVALEPDEATARSSDASSRDRTGAVVLTNLVDFTVASPSITARARTSCAGSVGPAPVARFLETAHAGRHSPGCSSAFQTGSRRRRFCSVLVLPWRGVIVSISCSSWKAFPFQWK